MGRLSAACGLAAALLAALVSPDAFARDSVLVLMSGAEAEAPEARARVQDALLEVGVGRVGFASPEALEGGLGLVSVNSRVEDDACGGVVPLAGWEQRLSRAETAPPDEALLELSLLDLEVACLDLLVSRSQLQRVQIGMVRVHLALARSGDDLTFHENQAATASEGLWALGEELTLPPGMAPEVERFILDYKPGFDRQDVAVVAGGAAGEVFLDGQRVGGERVVRSAGLHLVQVETGGVVLSAARPFLPEGDLVLWAGTLTAGELRAEVDALAAAGVAAPLLAAVEGLVGERVVVASVEAGGVQLYRPDGTPMTRGRDSRLTFGDGEPGVEDAVPRQPRERPMGTWAWTVGAGGTAGGGDFAYGPVDLAGASGGLAIWARGALSGDWTWTAALHTQARSERLPVNYDDDWVWRAHAPLRVGAHWGRPSEGISGDLGPEAVMVFLGSYGDEPKLRGGLALAGGGSFPLVAGFSARTEAWIGGGPSWWYSGGLTAGVERSW